MAEPAAISMTADLIAEAKSNLRSAPGLSAGLIRTLYGPLHVEAIGEKIVMDGYYWSELIYPEHGWIAWTTSYTNIKYFPVTGSTPPPTSPIVKVIVVNPERLILVHEDGTETPVP